MTLRDIDKTIYRRHLKMTTFATIAVLFVGALSFSTLLISTFGVDGQSNFRFNVMGVVVTLIFIGVVASQIKTHPYFDEMYYVWRVKFELSHINRKIRTIESAAKNSNVTAFNILAYYYQATRQVWQLDDNTIAMSELTQKENRLSEQMSQANFQPDVSNYQRQQLQQY